MDIKFLPRVSVNGYASKEYAMIAEYDGEYYLLEDLEIKSETKQVITKVNSKEELYRLYFNNVIKNPVDPFALWLLVKQKMVDPSYLPLKITNVISQTLNLDYELIESLERFLRDLEGKNRDKAIIIDISILIAIRDLINEASKEEIFENITNLVYEDAERIVFPDYLRLVKVVKEYLRYKREEEYKKRLQARKNLATEPIKVLERLSSKNIEPEIISINNKDYFYDRKAKNLIQTEEYEFDSIAEALEFLSKKKEHYINMKVKVYLYANQ